MIATHGDTSGVNLGIAGVSKKGTTLVGSPRGRDVTPFGVSRQIKDIAITARRQNDGIGQMGFDFAGDHVTGHNPTGAAINHDDIEHFGALIEIDIAGCHLAAQGLVGA